MRILVAGASGFVGQALIEALRSLPGVEVIAFSRNPRPDYPPVRGHAGDLFSFRDIYEAMEGCDQAVYLVHSMLPSADLVQGNFADMDLILVDNFARAARSRGVKHVMYLGGLVPEQGALSPHLQSRLEVERCLIKALPTVTVLRAGMILGAGGSSFTILRRLVERLPVMACPGWTQTLTQPVDLRDLVQVFLRCLTDTTLQGHIWDVGGARPLTYLEMLRLTAEALGKRPYFIPVGAFSPALSRLWIRLITGAPVELVNPLVESLLHPMVVAPRRRFPLTELLATPFEESLRYWSGKVQSAVHAFNRPALRERPRDVRSVQRLVLPRDKDAAWVAREYFRWLPHFFSLIIRVRVEPLRCVFYFLRPQWVLLILSVSHERSTSDRQLLYITGGWLASPNQGRGRLEFREALDRRYVLSAIHEFRPALPWFVYKWSQAVVHLVVMNAFARHLRVLDEGIA